VPFEDVPTAPDPPRSARLMSGHSAIMNVCTATLRPWYRLVA
jgi:hypothetical protein